MTYFKSFELRALSREPVTISKMNFFLYSCLLLSFPVLTVLYMRFFFFLFCAFFMLFFYTIQQITVTDFSEVINIGQNMQLLQCVKQTVLVFAAHGAYFAVFIIY